MTRLRSGSIKQNRDTLHAKDGSQCVFGVLLEILAEDGQVTKTVDYHGNYAYDGNAYVVPKVANKYSSGYTIRLLEMNMRQPFNKIADFIEDKIKGEEL